MPATVSECFPYYLTLLRSLPLRSNGAGSPVITLGITSCYQGEGVSTVAVQLGLAAAASGLRVLIVDLNAQRPTLHKTFDLPCSPGVADALTDVDVDAMGAPVRASRIANLSLLTVGSCDSEFHARASSERMSRLLLGLRPDYDLILCDLPPSAKGGADLMLARFMDAILLVIESERVRWEVASRVQQLLVRSGARVVGAILNKRRQAIPGWLYRTL